MTDPFAIVASIDEAPERQLWPGFEPWKIPLAVYAGSDTLLFRHPAPPEGFRAIADKPGVCVFEGRHSAIRANTSIELAGVHTATAMLDSTRRDTTVSVAALVVHEMFHAYQRLHHPTWIGNEIELLVYPLEDVELLRLRRLETEALRRALISGQSEQSVEARSWAATALSLRRSRFERLPEGAAAYERGSELNEGLAEYVEWEFAWPDKWISLPEGGFAVESVRARCYNTGHALAALLDDIDPVWKQELESGRASCLDELLETALSGTQAVPASFSQVDWESSRERASRDIEEFRTSRQRLSADLHNRPGHRIEILAADHDPLWPRGFDPSRMQRLTTAEILHERWLKLGNDLGEVEVLDRDAITEGLGGHPISNGIRKLTLTGLADQPTVQRSSEKLIVSAPGFAGEFRGAELDQTHGSVIVRLGHNL